VVLGLALVYGEVPAKLDDAAASTLDVVPANDDASKGDLKAGRALKQYYNQYPYQVAANQQYASQYGNFQGVGVASQQQGQQAAAQNAYYGSNSAYQAQQNGVGNNNRAAGVYYGRKLQQYGSYYPKVNQIAANDQRAYQYGNFQGVGVANQQQGQQAAAQNADYGSNSAYQAEQNGVGNDNNALGVYGK